MCEIHYVSGRKYVEKRNICVSAIRSHALYAAEYWIDVRIPEQYQREHIQGAINIPLKEIKSHIETVVPDRNDTVKLYCNSGRQSGMAKQMLLDMGYTHAMNMGGISRLDMPKVKK